MYQSIQLKNTIAHLRLLNSRPRWRSGFLLIPLAFAWLTLSPQAQAVCQQGCDLSTDNTFLGDDALISNTTGYSNAASGAFALFSNTTGVQNTAVGFDALFYNTTGGGNTANGDSALYGNSTGYLNTATGAGALFYNLTGYYNTANGYGALGDNRTGFLNTATGTQALVSNTAGNFNTADGSSALYNNIAGMNNTATGYSALYHNTGGSRNIALGFEAGINHTRGDNNIYVGNRGHSHESNGIRIGTEGTHTHTFIAGISGATVAGGVGVIIDTDGQLGTVVSSERFKDAIKPMDKASEAILALRAVTFRYKHELDPDGIPQFGLVAEQVEKVNPDLVAYDDQGKPYTVRYETVNAMLLNEFLKEHRKVEQQGRKEQELEGVVAQQQKEIETLSANLKEQASQIQKVSDQLEASQAAPRVVVSNQ